MNESVKLWLECLVGDIIKGSATAAKAFLGLAGANAIGVKAPELDWQGFLAVMLFAGIYSAVTDLSNRPLPGWTLKGNGNGNGNGVTK